MSIIELDPLEKIPVLDDEPKVEPDSVTKVLIDAKTYIEKHGWSGNGPYGLNNEVCVVVAINKVSPNTDHMQQAWTRFCKMNNIHHDIGEWNDTLGRTLEEVYRAFDKAIMNG